MTDCYLFDCEVFAYDWLLVFKHVESGEYTVIHNDNEAVKAFMETEPFIGGFNNKHYDQFILKAILCDAAPEQVKEVNDFIIIKGQRGWDNPFLSQFRVYFNQFDLFDDCQIGLSLKAFEAHLGMNIRESTVDFNLDRPLTEAELEEVIHYCKYDVTATEELFKLRQDYLTNKLRLGREKGIPPERALYMTNAKLTAAYLDASQQPHDDERQYQYPEKLTQEYIPEEVFRFFDRLHDNSIPDKIVFGEKLDIFVGECPCTIAYGGIHGAIPTYREETTEERSIRNLDVGSYYPHLMLLNGYCSRNMPSPATFQAVVDRRMEAKRTGDKATANALKLVANTTYGAMLNQYNDLYDPLMGRSVCISGQLHLLELANRFKAGCPTLKVIQLNTDGVMVSLDNSDLERYKEIIAEWEHRTGFELEEDLIKMICQKDVNNYVELPMKGKPKIKGGVLVRGVLTNGNVDFEAMGYPDWDNVFGGAFNINNNAVVVARAVRDCLSHGIPVEETINSCDTLLHFQLIAKAGGKYTGSFHMIDGEPVPVQKVNRVYATKDLRYGTLMKEHAVKKNLAKIAGLPNRCIVDNENQITLDEVDKGWYVRLAKRYVNDFLGIKPPRKNTRKINSLKKKMLNLLEV